MIPARATALLLLLALTACTGDDPAPSTPRVGASEPVPASGGRISFGLLGEPLTLDPYAKDASPLTYALARPVLPSLYRALPDGSVEPDLARSLQRTETGVRLTLRDASWSDGRPITSRDVVASWRRAVSPSGFTEVDEASVVDRVTITLEGDVREWEETLAIASFILPRGRFKEDIAGGPMSIARYRPGLRLDLAPNAAYFGEQPLLDSVSVLFYEESQVLLEDLAAGDLDAVAPPSSVNLSDRLDAAGIEHDSRSGSETIGLLGLSVDVSALAGVASAVDLETSFQAFVKGAGARHSVEAGDAPSGVTVAYPRGDELLSLLARSFHFQAREEGVAIELAEVEARFVHPLDRGALSGVDVVLMRDLAGSRGGRQTPFLPLYEVDSFIAWRPGVRGLAANPSLEGPLWNVEQWTVGEL